MLKKTMLLLLASVSLSSYAQDTPNTSTDKADLNIYTPINVVPKIKAYNYELIYTHTKITINTVMNKPVPIQTIQKELQAVCLLENKVDNKTVENSTINSHINDGFSIQLTPIEDANGHVKTLLTFTSEQIVGEARIDKINDRCTVVVGTTKTDTVNQIIDLEKNKSQKIQLPSGESILLTLLP